MSAHELIDSAYAEFSQDPNVIGVRMGERRTGDETLPDERVLIVLVKEKLATADVPSGYEIPEQFQGVPTDVFAPFSADAPRDTLGIAEGHMHSDDMSFVAWERLHEHWAAEANGSVAFHGNVQDFGDVCVIEDDGSLVKTVGGMQTVDFVQAYKLFRTTHPDIYDFVTFFTDSDHGMPPQGGSSWYRFVFNDTEGIGFSPTWDIRSSYDTDKLQGIMFLNQGHFSLWRYVMLQEQGHRWASFALYREAAGGPDKSDHLLGGWGHWSYLFDEDSSPLAYDPYNWVEEADGTFTRITLTSEERSYCNLDLYLMGLLGPEEVGNFYLLSNLTHLSGNSYSADKLTLTPENIIFSEGARSPSVTTSQKFFKNAFVVLTGDMEKAHDLVDEVDALRLRFEDDFREGTKNLAKVDTTLGPPLRTTTTEFRTVSVNIPRDTGRRSIERTVTFGGRVRAAAVALNGFKLDFAKSDHHINIAEADTDILSIDGNQVTFRVQCAFADKNFDDEYSGYVTALVIAEVW